MIPFARLALSIHAESDYTRLMRALLGVLGLILSCGAPVAAETSPRDVLSALNHLGLDSEHVYKISPGDRIELRQGDLALAFEQGKLAFFQPFEGRVTGFVFSGIGHALALPRDSIERQQLARFLGAPVLDQQFVSIYARFTDDTARDLLDQFGRASVQSAGDPAFASLWLSQLTRLNPTHSLRILVERYLASPGHFFHAGIDGILTGPFDALVDQMRAENFQMGQPRAVNKTQFYDAWVSYPLPGFSPPPRAFSAVRYQVNTTIHPDNSLEGEASIDFRAAARGDRILFLQLARALKVETVTLGNGENVVFFQNEGLSEQERRTRGDDSLCIFLSRAPQPGETFVLRFRYAGNVIENYGNSVLFVGARESWYPHYGESAEFALYNLTFRWPKNLRLVATGQKSEESEEGEYHKARWKTELPVSQAGFNLGEYAVASVSSGNHVVDVYANKLLEQALFARLAKPPEENDPVLPVSPAESGPHSTTRPLVMPPPSPAEALKSLAREVDSSIGFFEKFGGPFPFRHLAVSQIPGTFGQGWPGLLYLSTFSYLSSLTQEQAGLNTTSQEAFTDIIPVHEVAHQWWGNVVGWSSYRDQWLDEAISMYLAVLFADSQKNSDRSLNNWLIRYRKRLLTKTPESDRAPADAGPLVLGTRLSSSKSLDAYDAVIYSKGPWVIHMLRELLREPGAHDPDARFTSLLRTLATKYAQKALTTDQFQKEVEGVMTRRMDLEGGHSMEWFFEEYVRGTGIPHYKVEYTSRRTESGFQVHGKLLQSGVPHSFIAPVPLYIHALGGKLIPLGTVNTAGEETPFSFSSKTDARKIVINPHMTLLCAAE